MNNEAPQSALARRTQGLHNATKAMRDIAFIAAVLFAGLVQFVGPGLSDWLREWSGHNDLEQQMNMGFEGLHKRLDFVEDNMAPPKIINWLTVRSLGACNETSCRKMHEFSRTLYGESCGIPDITAEIRLSSGDKFPLISDFRPIEGRIVERRVVHDFKIESEMYDGEHHYQFTLNYPSCEWSREPIPRLSPWFKIRIDRGIQ